MTATPGTPGPGTSGSGSGTPTPGTPGTAAPGTPAGGTAAPGAPAPADQASQVPAVPEPPAPEPEVRGHRTGMFGGSVGQDTSGYGGLETQVYFPPAATRPFGGYFDAIGDALEAQLPAGHVEKVVVDRGEMTVFVPREHIVEIMQVLRDDPDLRFEMCLGVSGVHYPEDTGRELHAVYHLLSLTHGGRRLRVETTCPDGGLEVSTIPSVISVYPSADWHERETWDMFGIVFTGREWLTRILMPDDWQGHPQRKDYPLGGIPVEYKGAWVPSPEHRRTYN